MNINNVLNNESKLNNILSSSDEATFNKIFDDKELNEFEKKLFIIPDDIKKNIYYDYFYPNEPRVIASKLCDELLNEIDSFKHTTCNTTKLSLILTKVLENNLAIEYLYNNYCYYDKYNNTKRNYFRIVYDKIIINKEKNYINFNEVDDFALSLLSYIYH